MIQMLKLLTLEHKKLKHIQNTNLKFFQDYIIFHLSIKLLCVKHVDLNIDKLLIQTKAK